jgi:glutamate synthase (NADPH/NADH) small chain
MPYLVQSDRVQHGDVVSGQIDARGKRVVIIGGGDTGTDCLGTAHRQGAASVVHLDIRSRPPDTRSRLTPWPTWPLVLRSTAAHEEGGDRVFAATSHAFIDDGCGNVAGIRLLEARTVADGGGARARYEPIPGTERLLPADLVLLALGFTGPEHAPLCEHLGLTYDEHGAYARGDAYETAAPGVYVAGDAGRGQSLIVWAIAEGRGAAASIDAYLSGTTILASPIRASDRPIG